VTQDPTYVKVAQSYTLHLYFLSCCSRTLNVAFDVYKAEVVNDDDSLLVHKFFVLCGRFEFEGEGMEFSLPPEALEQIIHLSVAIDKGHTLKFIRYASDGEVSFGNGSVCPARSFGMTSVL